MSNKVFQKLLADLKKANQTAKLKLATKFGFKTVDAYQQYLEEEFGKGTIITKAPSKKATSKKKTQVVAEKPTIHNVHILDESGSMAGPKFHSALEGINSEIERLKKDDTIKYTQTVVGFSDFGTDKVYFYKTDIQQVTRIKSHTRGGTALNDCVGNTLNKLFSEANGVDKYIVTIFTDGEENSSRLFTYSQIAELIKKCEEKGFTITFMGTKNDVATVTRSFQLFASNTLVHDNTSRGISDAYMSRTTSVVDYSRKVKKGENVKQDFFKKVGKL